MTEEGKYIYCIIGDNIDRRFGPPRREPKVLLRGSIGINNREVSLVHYKDISAAVSSTPIINFDRLDKKELTRHIATHQKVNEEVMKDYDVVPMAFGIIAPNLDEVLRILERAHLQFKTTLEKIRGKVEFTVQVWWDQKKLLEELVGTVPEIQKLKQEASLKKSILAMPIKMKLGKLIHQEVEAHRYGYIKDIHALLRNSSHDSTSNKLIEDARPVGSQGLSFGDMIANFSFLIEKAKEPELDCKMQELGKKYEGKLRFKYIGPMPPYSFANINLKLGNFEVVDEARKLLGLGEQASLDEIRKAYHALAHQYHPDKHQGDPKTEQQMKRITEAYDVLVNYCPSCYKLMRKGEGPAEGEARLGRQRYSFKEEDVRNSLIIK